MLCNSCFHAYLQQSGSRNFCKNKNPKTFWCYLRYFYDSIIRHRCHFLAPPTHSSLLWLLTWSSSRKPILWQLQIYRIVQAKFIPQICTMFFRYFYKRWAMPSSVKCFLITCIWQIQGRTEGCKQFLENGCKRQDLASHLSESFTAVFQNRLKKKKKNWKYVVLNCAGAYLAKLFKVLLYIFHYCIRR